MSQEHTEPTGVGLTGGGRTMTRHVELAEGDAAPSNAAIAGHPIHPMLIPFPIGLLGTALAADVAFLVTGDEFFARAALWLVGAGVITGLVAAVPGAIDYFTIRRARASRTGQVHAIGNGVALALAALNLVLRISGDAADVILPWGLVLSAATGLLLVITGWAGGELSYRHLVGVHPKAAVQRPVRQQPE